MLERLERVSGRAVDVVHVIGGGARNRLLCRLTADVVGRPVLAGPVEATALGNVLVQARATGELGSLAELREVAAACAEPELHEPGEVEVDPVSYEVIRYSLLNINLEHNALIQKLGLRK